MSLTGDIARSLWRSGWVLWLLAGVLLCGGLGIAAVSRTQEARVLETAREILGGDVHNWLIPRVNGNIRLQKPPLAYWLTAFCYQMFGVSEGAGRIPAAVAAWLTVGITAALTAWLFGRRAAFFAGAALLGSFLFFRFGRFAETDVLATLFVTAAVYALWRGYGRDDNAPPTFARSAAWFHAAAAAIALCMLSKGPPAAYPLLFFITMAAFDRRWNMVGRFVACGAPLTLALIALPWFLYVRQDPDYVQLVRDLKNSAGGGRGHSALFVTYIPPLFAATAPWSALMPLALIFAARNWRRDRRLRGMIILVACMLLPVSAWGNKQLHYLMPVMPPIMALVGWLLDEALKEGSALRKPASVLWGLTVVGAALAPVGVLVGAPIVRGHLIAADGVVTAFLLAAVAVVALAYRARGLEAALQTFAAGTAVAVFVLMALWAPTLHPVDTRQIAAALHERYGNGPYAFLGKEDLPLVFHMKRIIPVARNQGEIEGLAGRRPPVVFIEPISGTNRPRPFLQEQMRFVTDTTTYRVGYIAAARTTAPATAPATAPSAPADSDPGE